MAHWDVQERHAIELTVTSDRAYAAITEADFSKSSLLRMLFALRGLSWRRPLCLGDLNELGFVLLGEDQGTEIVYGLVGRFWQPRGGLHPVPAGEFVSFADPGYAKAAWSFRVDLAGSGVIVSTETRVVTTDPRSRRSFRWYWRLIRPFSALIRRRMLGMIRDRAEGSC